MGSATNGSFPTSGFSFAGSIWSGRAGSQLATPSYRAFSRPRDGQPVTDGWPLGSGGAADDPHSEHQDPGSRPAPVTSRPPTVTNPPLIRPSSAWRERP